MTDPDLRAIHLEVLRDRELAGTLTPEDRARLEAHVAADPASRLERHLAADAARAAASRDPETLWSAIEAELHPAAAPRPSYAWARAAAVLLAATMVGGSVAAAATIPWVREWVLSAAPVEPESPPRAAPAPPIEVPIADAPETAELDTEPEAERPARARPDARTLYRLANEARNGGDREGAVQLYRALIARFPRSGRASTARIQLGTLLLSRDAQGALRQFDAYLAAQPRGPLAEEAHLGRARACQRLGRRTDERRAWRSLLDAYPASVHADEARRRLDER